MPATTTIATIWSTFSRKHITMEMYRATTAFSTTAANFYIINKVFVHGREVVFFSFFSGFFHSLFHFFFSRSLFLSCRFFNHFSFYLFSNCFFCSFLYCFFNSRFSFFGYGFLFRSSHFFISCCFLFYRRNFFNRFSFRLFSYCFFYRSCFFMVMSFINSVF